MTDYLKYLNDRAVAMGYIGEELDEQSALNWIANAWSLDVNDANYVLKRDLDFELDKKADKEHTYTMDEMDIQLDEKADKSNTYTKKEVDDAIAAGGGSGTGGVTESRVIEIVESETAPKFDLKADKSETYTKTEVDGLIPTIDVDKAYVDTELGKKADIADLDLKADKSDTYTKQEVDDKVAAGGGSADVDKAYVDAGLALKADKTDTYTKTEVNDLVDQAAIGLPLEQGLHGVTPNGYEKITPDSMGYGPAHDWSWELSAVSGDKFGKMDKWGVNYHALWCDSPTSTLQLGPYDNSLQIGGFGNNGIFGMISDFGDDKLGFYMDTKLGVLEMAGNDGIKRRILTKGDTYETHETYTKLEIDNAISMIPASEKFTDLADTPSGYHPNKLVGYNLAGDALIPVDKTESFLQLNDVPSTWVGQARKVPMVRPDETGMDFVMLPSTDLGPLEGRMSAAETSVGDHETRITAIELGGGPGTGVDLTPVLDRLTVVETKNAEQDTALGDHIAEFEAMIAGQIPTSWNGLACDPMSSSGDVTAVNIATSPFCVGMGSTTGRKFTLPDIVDANASSLTNSQVREGRVTYIVNLGTVPRTVEMTGGCKINMTGINTTSTQTIPAKVTWMLSPGIYSNGDRVWTFLGSYSAEPLDYANMHNGYAEKISLMAGATPVHMGSMFSTSTPVWDTVTQEQAALREVINFWGTSTSRGVNLPDIVDGNTTTVPANAVRSGRMLIIANRSSNNKFMKVDNGCQFYKDATDLSTANINLAKGNVVVLVASKSGADKYWQLIGSFTATASTDHEGLINRVTTLEGRPNPKFTELTDTPNDYRPGRILAYNMAGDGITSLDPFNHLTALDDTPSSYIGQKRKALVVKEDESGTEFASLPDLGPINTDIANLENEIVRLDNEQYIQDQAAEALEAKVDLIEDWKSKIDSVDTSIKIDSRVIQKPTEVKDGAFTAAEINLKDVVIIRGTTARTVTMPEVIVATATSATSTQTRVGREIKISNYSSQQVTVNTTSSQKFVKWDGTTVDTHLVPAGKTVTLNAIYWNGTSSGFAWAITRDAYADNSSSTADAWIAKVESGDSSAKVNSNNIFGSMQIKDGSLTAEELATCSAGYIIGSTSRTATLPKVIDVSASTVGAGEARFGKQMKIANMSTQNLTVNVKNSGRIYTSGSNYSTSVTLAAGKYADFHAVWWPGGGYNNFCWVKCGGN